MGLVELLVIAGLVFLNGFFVAAEFALVKVRIEPDRPVGGAGELGRQAHQPGARQPGCLPVGLAGGHHRGEPGAGLGDRDVGREEHRERAPRYRSPRWPARRSVRLSVSFVPLVAFTFVTFLHVALGEQAPKSLAIRSAKTIALWTAPPLIAIYYAFWPVIWLLNNSSRLTLRLLGLGKTDHAELAHTEEELRHIVAESVDGGHLSRRERVMIENVLNLEEKTARRVMVPRPDIVYLSLSRSIEDNLRIARQAGHTRYPLCEDDLTTVIGMIHVKDLFRAGASSNGRPDLRRSARQIPFLPETLRLDLLLVEFQRNRVHLAMVIDEYGSVVGMVGMENVLEELVGPIQDEFDRESPQVTPLGEGIFEVDASCPLDTLAEACGFAFPETDAETAGGLVLDKLGRLAKIGDSVTVDGHRLTVLRADPTRIRRIRVEPLADRAANGADLTETSN